MADKKTPEKKTLKKGDFYSCDVCGLTVTIDENHAYTENTMLVCCGHNMKPKAPKAAAKR
jgi:hypothetical protein